MIDDSDMDVENQTVSSERDPILELQPTVRIPPLELPPREGRYGGSTTWVMGWCGCLGWLVILGLVGWTVQQSLIADQRYQASIEDETVWNQKIKDLEQRLEVETQRHTLTTSSGTPLRTLVQITQSLSATVPAHWQVNLTLQGHYELIDPPPLPNRSLGSILANATWYFGPRPTNASMEWYSLETRQGSAAVYQSLDGSMLCAVPKPEEPPTCIYPRASVCASLSTVSYHDLDQFRSTTWILHYGPPWCI